MPLFPLSVLFYLFLKYFANRCKRLDDNISIHLPISQNYDRSNYFTIHMLFDDPICIFIVQFTKLWIE